ncbi:hypothetical protein BDB00DRAFT_480345 [Zychaea mexicana]|uniref:uncharacterized protein n=1 Tax=Zychaea mexicana TaxID=64656 RepID=UPI0022FDC2F8|nr:uncharacterized protein BDB00DRAFT_480345 [Zychaea mexicana]KAI9491575.1 hypothetical protein BDB00DRAFT_480345 [Zychaea mexicana]
MSIAQWRQFNFFDKQQVVDPTDKSKSPAVFQKSDISVLTSGRGQIALADSKGQVYISDRNFKTHSFVAYDGGRVTHLKQLKQKNILVTVGEEDNGTPVVKFWDLDSVDRSKLNESQPYTPTCIRTIKIQHGTKPYPVSIYHCCAG